MTTNTTWTALPFKPYHPGPDRASIQTSKTYTLPDGTPHTPPMLPCTDMEVLREACELGVIQPINWGTGIPAEARTSRFALDNRRYLRIEPIIGRTVLLDYHNPDLNQYKQAKVQILDFDQEDGTIWFNDQGYWGCIHEDDVPLEFHTEKPIIKSLHNTEHKLAPVARKAIREQFPEPKNLFTTNYEPATTGIHFNLKIHRELDWLTNHPLPIEVPVHNDNNWDEDGYFIGAEAMMHNLLHPYQPPTPEPLTPLLDIESDIIGNLYHAFNPSLSRLTWHWLRNIKNYPKLHCPEAKDLILSNIMDRILTKLVNGKLTISSLLQEGKWQKIMSMERRRIYSYEQVSQTRKKTIMVPEIDPFSQLPTGQMIVQEIHMESKESIPDAPEPLCNESDKADAYVELRDPLIMLLASFAPENHRTDHMQLLDAIYEQPEATHAERITITNMAERTYYRHLKHLKEDLGDPRIYDIANFVLHTPITQLINA